MDDIYILQKLKPSDLNREDKEFRTTAAVFLTYSIENKTVLTGLMSLFDIPETDTDDKGETIKLEIKERWERLFEFESRQWQQERIGFICNDGYDKSIGSPISYYTEGFIAYHKIPEEERYYSFHPKLYVIRYDANEVDPKKKETVFRFLIGSMNFVNSRNKEFMTCFDLRAYDKQEPEREFVKIDWLKKLIGYSVNTDGSICQESIGYNNDSIGNKNGKVHGCNIVSVLNNLNLERYWFEKEKVPEVIIYPDNSSQRVYEKCTDIFSPFLSDSLTKNDNMHPQIYTTWAELKKHGYEKAEQKGEDTEKFFVYEVDNNSKGKKLNSHFKVYINSSSHNPVVYAGSPNFTDSAFHRNKEILVRVPIETEKIGKYLDEIKADYVEYYVKKTKEAKENKADLFKKLAVNLGRILRVNYKNQTVGLTVSGGGKGRINLFEEWEKIKNSMEPGRNTEYSIDISPFYYSSKRKSIIIKKDQVGIKSKFDQDCWMGLNRRNISQKFIIYLIADSKDEASAVIYLESDESFSEVNEMQEAMRNEYLNRVFSSSSFDSVSLNKEVERLQNNMNNSKFVNAFRHRFPSIEDMMKKALKEKKEINDVLDLYYKRIQDYLKVAELLQTNGESEEEKREYAYYDGKLIENLNKQIGDLRTLFESGEEPDGV